MVRLPSGAFRRRAVPCVGTAAGGGCSPDEKCVSGDDLLCQGTSSPSCGLPPQRSARADPERRRLEDVYTVEEAVLGSGGFGTVRQAWPKFGGPVCVVKTLPKSTRPNVSYDYLAENARQEAEVLHKLDHERICKILDVYEDAQHVYLVLEYIEGRELFDEVVENGPMSEHRASGIMRQIFEALEHCHQPGRSVLHRDLKPENVMVCEDVDCRATPSVKLIDFGLAAFCPDESTLQSPVVGTAEYLAPEALAEGLYSRASDLWSAGAVLHMILTGGALPSPVGANGCNVQLLRELKVSKSAQELLQGLLRSKPEERLTALEARVHPWTQGVAFNEDIVAATGGFHSGSIFVDTILTPEKLVANRGMVVYSDLASADCSEPVPKTTGAGAKWPGFCGGIDVENKLLQLNSIDVCNTSSCDAGRDSDVAVADFKENVLPKVCKPQGHRRGRRPLKSAADENVVPLPLLGQNICEQVPQRRPLLIR